MIEGHATARFVRGSAQKAKLVLDLIRGQDVNRALATLRFSRKRVARDVSKVLRSAIANLQQKEGATGDVDRLYVGSCYANQGTALKRIRAAPMGRAFRIIKRTSHLTVVVNEHPEKVVAVTVGDSDPSTPSPPKRKTAKSPRSRTTARKTKTTSAAKAAKAAKTAKADQSEKPATKAKAAKPGKSSKKADD